MTPSGPAPGSDDDGSLTPLVADLRRDGEGHIVEAVPRGEHPGAPAGADLLALARAAERRGALAGDVVIVAVQAGRDPRESRERILAEAAAGMVAPVLLMRVPDSGDVAVIATNASAQRLSGMPAEAILRPGSLDRFEHAFGPALEEAVRRVAAGGGPEGLEYPAAWGGATRSCLRRLAAPGPGLVGVLVFDVTPQQEARAAGRRAAESFRALADALPDAVDRMDPGLRHVYVNPAWERLTGVPAGQALGRTCRETGALAPDVLDRFEEAARAVARDGEARTIELIAGDRRCETQIVPEHDEDGRVVNVLAVARDLTDVHQARQHADEAAESFRALVDGSPDIIARVGRDMRLAYGNPALAQLIGVGADDLVGLTGAGVRLLDGDTAGRMEALVGLVFATGRAEWTEAEIMTPSGRRQLDVRLVPEYGPDGRVTHVAVAARDVTDLKDAQAEALGAAESYRALAEHSPDAIVRIGADRRFAYVNATAAGLVGQPPDRMVGTPHPPPGMPPELATLLESAVTAAFAGEVVRLQHPFPSPAGERWMLAHVVPEPDAEGVVQSVLLVSRDETDRHRAELRLAERDAEQAALLAVATAVAEGRPTGEVFSLVAREAASLVGAEAAALVSFEDPGQIVVGTWPPPGRLGVRVGESVPVATWSVVGQVARSGLPWRVAYPLGVEGPVLPGGTGVGVPVAAGGGLWGVLVVGVGADVELGAGTEARLARFAGLVATAVENAAVRERLEREAATDALTGLANRREFMRRLAESCHQARRLGYQVSVAVLDLDHFKRVNDTHGHEAGDGALVAVARLLDAHCRAGETVGRLGGEEFGWLMVGSPAVHAAEAAERLRAALRETDLDGAPGLTISAGVADMDAGGDPGTMLRLADRALYRAKAEGRDRVVVAGPEG